MAAKEIRFEENARNKMLAGVNLLADTVKVTLVPERRYPKVLRAIRCERSRGT